MNQALVLVWNLSLMVAIRLNNIHKGSDRDFVFRREASLWEPPQATIGLQRSVLPDVGGHWCTVPFVFYENNLAYVTILLFHIKFRITNEIAKINDPIPTIICIRRPGKWRTIIGPK